MNDNFPHFIFSEEQIDQEKVLDYLLRVNSSDSRNMTNPVSIVITETTDRLAVIKTQDGISGHRYSIPGDFLQKNPPIMHTHNYLEMTFIMEGEVDIRIENELYHYQKGDICLLNQSVHHTEVYRGQFKLAFLCFAPELLEKYSGCCASSFYPQEDLEYQKFFGSCMFLERPAGFLEFRPLQYSKRVPAECIMNQILQELVRHLPGYTHILYGLLTRLHYVLADETWYRKRYVRVQLVPDLNLVDIIRNYIYKRRCRFTRDEIEDALHYNRDYLNRVFRQYTGMTLGDYSRAVCMDEAGHLLLYTNDTIEKISEKVGFPNRTQFYRLFKQYYHVTPREYRKRKRQKISDENKKDLTEK